MPLGRTANFTTKWVRADCGAGALAALGIPVGSNTVATARIARGLVQTILRQNAGKPWKRLFAGISHRVLDLAFQSPDLQLSTDYSTTFRDFSGTTRIGELGQALAWSIFTERTSFALFVDFAEGLNMFGIPPMAGGPDFMVFNRSSAEFLLLECKGSASVHGGPSLKAGLNQCAAAVAHLAPHGYAPVRSIASCARFSCTRRAILALRDPEEKGALPPDLHLKCRRLAYAPWFEAAGNREAPKLRRGEPIEIKPKDDEFFVHIGETDEMDCFMEANALRRIGPRLRPTLIRPSGKEAEDANDPEIIPFGDGTAARPKPALFEWLKTRHENRETR